MKKIVTYITYTLGVVVALCVTGCSDAPEEITEVDYDRLFSVHIDSDFTTNVINQTTLRMTWTAVDNAEAYVIELFADDEDMSFEGTPSRTVETEYKSPLLIEGLQGESTYAGRIKAVASGIADSKWVEFSFETGAENIFASATVGIHDVTLTWSAEVGGTDLSTITVRSTEGDQTITHNLTSSEMAEGTATIDGLIGFTTYTAVMLSADGTHTRGTITFTTNYDGIAIEPGESLKEAIESAADGEVLALMPGEHTVDANLELNKSISIVAAVSDDRPVVVGAQFNLIETNVNLTLTNLILDGTGRSNVTYVSDEVAVGDILIESCEIINYEKAFLSPGSSIKFDISSYTINNCIAHDCGASGNDIFDVRAGIIRNLTITNSTFYGFGARHFLRHDSSITGNITITIDKCTFYGMFNSTSYGLLYVRQPGNCYISNCIITNTVGVCEYSGTTITTTYSNNYFYEADNAAGNDPSGKIENPEFADPENGDFTIMNENVYYSGAGDPRWIQ